MCGRIYVINDPLCQRVNQQLALEFFAASNANLSPGQVVSTVTCDGSGYRQLDALWGIKPGWAKRLIINAQAETVAEKPTFGQAFISRRCLIPCCGWFEWREEAGTKKKYLFSHFDNAPLYMAGIWFPGDKPRLVTLTTSANEKCSAYHRRMPALILPENIDYWFRSPPAQLAPVLAPVSQDLISVHPAC